MTLSRLRQSKAAATVECWDAIVFQKYLHALLLLGCCALAQAQGNNMAAVPAALIQGGELVDVQNGFAIRVDQPGMMWSIANGIPSYTTKYVGINKERRLIFTVFVDRRSYAEQTVEWANKYADGLREGLLQGGWSIQKSDVSRARIPREISFFFSNEATHSNGARATFVEYMTSPNNLYSIGAVLPGGEGREALEAFVKTFRLLK